MSQLNYHHLRYFRAIVREGTLTAAAERLNVSQSALSVQLKQLEFNLGCQLFDRMHKSLQLTEEGRIVFDYAETIFKTGEELLATVQNLGDRFREVIRVGAVANLSRNFQLSFLKPVIDDESTEVIISSASMGELLSQLNDHMIDLVLSNRPAKRDTGNSYQNYRVASQPVSLIAGPKYRKKKSFRFPEDLKDIPLVLPTAESEIRNQIDLLLEHAGIAPLIAAEADDMAMLRLLARDIDGIAVLPPVVVMDELEKGELFELYQIPDLHENFYAITVKRKFPNPHLKVLLDQQTPS